MTKRDPRGQLVLLAGILVVAAALRGIGLDAGLWYDEVVTLVEFVRLPTPELLTTYTTPNNHILYTLLAQGSVAAFGETAWALRLPAVVFGVASVGALWLLGTRVTSPTETALAAGLAAISYHHVWFSQNARAYTGLLLCILLATWLFVGGMRRPGRGVWVAYAAVVAIALYLHLSAVFAIAAQGIVYFAMFLRRRFGRLPGDDQYPGAAQPWPLLGFALAAGLTALIYAPLIPQMTETFGAESSSGAKVEAWTNPLWTVTDIVNGLGLGPLSWVVALLGASIATVGVVSYARRDPMLTAIALIPIPITLLALTALSFHVWPRYFFVSAGFALLLGVRGLLVTARAIGRPWQASRPAAAIAAATAVLAAATMLPKNYRLPKQDYAGARAWVEEQRQPGEPVLTAGMAAFCYERYFATDWQTVDDLEDLTRARQGHASVWLVYSFPTALAASHAELHGHLNSEFEVAAEFHGTLADGTIYVCRSR